MKTALGFLAAALTAGLPAGAYVEAVYPLAQVLAESEVIVEGVVEKHEPQKMIAFIKTGKALKGKCRYETVRMNYGGGQFYHPKAIPQHLAPGAPVLMFYNAGLQSQVYLNRFFFQLYGDAGAPPEKAWWNFTHIEIRMNRTFNGTVPELSTVVQNVLAGKAKAPAPVAKLPPMDEPALKALPPHPEPQDLAKLPAPFRPFDPNAKSDASAVDCNPEGIVMKWLLLGPIPLGPAAADPNAALSKDWIPNQKTLRPQQHEKAAVNGTEFRWEVVPTSEWFLDLGSAENVVHLCLTYLHADADLNEVFLLTGSDDHAAWWLNGEEVQRYIGGRGVAKDQDRSAKPLSLRKGCNVLLAAVINGGGPTGATARFVTKDNQPVKLKSGAEPK
jgi:hypothetical protein